jgi:hypothetical protein
MPRQKVDNNLLLAALDGLELQRQKLEGQIQQVKSMLGTRRGAAPARKAAAARPARKRELSAAARRRISAAQKKRWAEYRRRMAAA